MERARWLVEVNGPPGVKVGYRRDEPTRREAVRAALRLYLEQHPGVEPGEAYVVQVLDTLEVRA
jgi:hypothetical protein